MENRVLSIYDKEITFSMDVTELQDKFDELIVYSRLIGYRVDHHYWTTIRGGKVLRFDFDRDVYPHDFYIEFYFNDDDIEKVKSVWLYCISMDQAYPIDDISHITSAISRMIELYI